MEFVQAIYIFKGISIKQSRTQHVLPCGGGQYAPLEHSDEVRHVTACADVCFR